MWPRRLEIARVFDRKASKEAIVAIAKSELAQKMKFNHFMELRSAEISDNVKKSKVRRKQRRKRKRLRALRKRRRKNRRKVRL